MDVSYILSADELFTMLSLIPDRSEAGYRVCDEVLSGAYICDLSELVEKRMARRIGNELEIEPVIHMLSNAIAKADYAENVDGIWNIRSPWVSLLCERYPYRKNNWKLTPVDTSTKK